jgi:hypothetical protein
MKNKSLLILLFCSSIIFGQQQDKDGIYLNVEKMPAIKGGFSAVAKKNKISKNRCKNAHARCGLCRVCCKSRGES